METHIEGRNVSLDDDLKAEIEARLQKLAKGHDDIVHARISLQKDSKHQHGHEEITLVFQVRGEVLTVHKTAATLLDAVQAGFQAMQRELTRYRDKFRDRSWTVRDEGTRVPGLIARVFHEREFGFVETGDGDEIFFNRKSLKGVRFDKLEAGTPVELTIEHGKKGLQAARLWLAAAGG